MRWLWPRRHKPEEAPAVKEAVEDRDRLFNELDLAIQEVDRVKDRVSRVKNRVIDDYARADRQRTARRQL